MMRTGLRWLSFALGLAAFAAGTPARAERPRFVMLFDTSGSMTEDSTRTVTHGDGSVTHPGCDLDGNGLYDDSKLFQAKAALNDVVSAFGTAEFALARYHQDELGQACTVRNNCRGGANVCQAGHCGFIVPAGSPDYDECTSGRGCMRCANPASDPTEVYYYGGACCPAGGATSNGFGLAGDVVVPFPTAGGSNVNELLSWMDGREDFPAGSNRELRASGTTPIGGALNAVRDWLVNDASSAGSGAGALNHDAGSSCRSYNVVLITDGLEVATCVSNCKIDAATAAGHLYHACTNGGLWNSTARRCERAGGDTSGTSEVRVRTWVVGFAVNDPQLNTIAAAGGTGVALVANNQAELTARLSDIIASSIPTERCDCQDNTCDGQIDETFTAKGAACSVGVGRCKRQGTLGCQADGTGLVCSAQPSGLCPAAGLQAGAPVTEQCGAAPGCDAPTAEDCADDDCDGLVDENMSCACTSKPELCNGLDDDCNGKVDDIPRSACGLDVGECKPGTSVCEADGAGGGKALCEGAIEPAVELCDGKDNDCDGVVDHFGLGCYPDGAAGCTLSGAPVTCGGAPATKFTCVGACATGVVTCGDGTCGACAAAITPVTEIACDGVDNDCDGQVDEGFNLGGSCGPGASGVGACRAGVLACDAGLLVCAGGQGPVEEVCNGADDDCDGQTDNIPGVCGPARGECQPGRWRCEGTLLTCDQPLGPSAEFCDGRDNDCDGTIDEDPIDPELLQTTSCGSDVGVCKPGVYKCLGGGLVCAEGVEPVREACNGADDDCDGQTDEGINPPGACPPPGLALGAPVVGECRPGANVCAPSGASAAWTCLGGVGPAAEVCNGKDDDCDGTVDEDARCPEGEACADGECVDRCGPGGVACALDRVCREGLCRYVECARRACAPTELCHPQRGCVDRCEGVTCPTGTRCAAGACTSCLLTGCPAGQVCRGPDCTPDPCASKACAGDSFCRDGACVKSCRGVTCNEGTACRDGVCVEDRCAAVTCGNGQMCNPKTGACVANACAQITCLPGQVCVGTEALCALNPCAVTRCGKDEVCVVRVDGTSSCALAKAGVEIVRTANAGGSGCSCDLGGARFAGGAWWALALALAAAARLRRAR